MIDELISKEHIEKPADALKIGDEVTAKVVDFNAESQKISLSIKALLPDAEEETADVVVEEAVAEEAPAEE